MATKKLGVILADDYYENLELHYPRLRLKEAGFEVKVAGPEANKTYKSKEGYWAQSDCVFADIDPAKVAVLIIPGGYAPDRLRRYEACLSLVKAVNDAGGVIGQICHGPWVSVSAKILKGRRATCFFAIKDDVINAGAEYSTDKVVVDGKLVSAQTPEDLPEFMAAILKLV
jgi:protease I